MGIRKSHCRRYGWPVVMALGVMLLVSKASAMQVSIAAIVGDEVITTTDVNERRDLVLATAGIPATLETQQKITPRIVQGLIDETLQLREAKALSLSVSDDELAKAIAALSTRGNPPETIQNFIARSKLSQRSFENQLRAQLAWNKVVQRKVRRNVSVGQDEVARAQAAAATAPGEMEVRLQAIEIKAGDKDAPAMSKLVDEVALAVQSGDDFTSIAARYAHQPALRLNPPVWMAEKSLPVPLQQALRSMKEGQSTPALKGDSNAQFIQLIERKAAPKLADTTEYAIKQIAIPLPKKRDNASVAALNQTISTLKANPGSCESAAIPAVSVAPEVQFVRATLGALNPQQRNIISHLEVGEVSAPLPGPDAVRLVVVCEKIEAPGEALPNADAMRQQLFAEKLELEAQKYLRNLRRDAFIDIKGQ